MKSHFLVRAALLLLVVCVCVRCSSEDEQVAKKDTIPFSFTLSSEMVNDGGRVAGLNDVVAALITLTNTTGDQIILDKKEVKIYQYGGAYVTESVPLKPARYNVTEFMLIDADQNVIYATPVKGSLLAKDVTKPLPINFVVSKDAVKDIEMQVVSADGVAPGNFGYAAFGIKLMMSFQLSTVLADNGSVGLTDALLTIREAGELRHPAWVVHTQPLEAKTNKVLFSGDDEKLYTLDISKEGYGTYTRNFTFQELQNELAGQPLVITFTPSFNMTVF
jgi:hypothetical protein